jgi:hypothetical protein
MAKSPRVFTHCRWDCNRIAILFIDKELSIDITLEEAKELFSKLGPSINSYEALEKDIEEYSSNKD